MIRRAFALLLLALAIAAASAQTFYWENPRPIVDGQGRYPSALPLGEGFVVMWQESEPANGTPPGPEFHGRAWLSLGRIVQGRWEYQRRFAGPYEFRGAEPILYSAAVSANGRIAVVATGDTGAVEILVSEDGARSFARSVLLSPLATRLAPRIYPSASGGWIVFSAQVDSQIPVEGSPSRGPRPLQHPAHLLRVELRGQDLVALLPPHPRRRRPRPELPPLRLAPPPGPGADGHRRISVLLERG
jgi:hypothetical protein